MTKLRSFILLSALCMMALTSCISDKSIIYLQGADATYAVPKNIEQAFELIIKPDDQLAISVATKDRDLIVPFNNNTLIGGGVTEMTGTSAINTTSGISYFRVNNDGYIAFPIFGLVSVQGLTTRQCSEKIQNLLRNGNGVQGPYIMDAIVNTKIMSFKVTVLGDVRNPGTQTFTGERLTLLEAIGRAGDMNNSAQRNNVLVVREENGKRVTYEVNMLDEACVFQSPAYYLQQNDVVYVSPNKSVKVKGSASYTLLSVSSTLVGMAVSIISLIIALNKN